MAAKGSKKPVDDQRGKNGRDAKGRFGKGNSEGFKGHPERINRDGRPKDHDALRRLIQRIAGEALADKPEWSQIELMLRAMMKSKQASDRKEILEHGWGKVPQQLDINVKDVDAAINAELARLAGRSQAEDAATSSGETDPGASGSDNTQSA